MSSANIKQLTSSQDAGSQSAVSQSDAVHVGHSRTHGGGACGVNVGNYERLASMAFGTTLTACGLFRAQRGRLPLAGLGAALVYRGLTGHCSVNRLLGRNSARPRARRTDEPVIPACGGEKIAKSVTINCPASELYQFWRRLENLPKVMRHLKRVEALDGRRSHWIAEGTLGRTVEWDAEITNERENEMLAWESLPGGAVDTAGSVHFKELPHNRGTEVTVSLKYNPPAGKLGAWVATLFGDGLEQKLAGDLTDFKRIMEAGEVPTTAGQTSGRRTDRGDRLAKRHEARPHKATSGANR